MALLPHRCVACSGGGLVVVLLPFAIACATEDGRGDANAGTGAAVGLGGGGGTGATSGGTGGTSAGTGGAGTTDAGDASPFAHCANQWLSKCTLEATCQALGCGEPWSVLDGQGCERAQCKRDADCTSDERCLPSLLVKLGCQSSFVEQCIPEQGFCNCYATADCAGLLRCVPKAIAPLSGDCDFQTTDCDTLKAHKALVENLSPSLGAEVTQAAQACVSKLETQLSQNGC